MAEPSSRRHTLAADSCCPLSGRARCTAGREIHGGLGGRADRLGQPPPDQPGEDSTRQEHDDAPRLRGERALTFRWESRHEILDTTLTLDPVAGTVIVQEAVR